MGASLTAGNNELFIERAQKLEPIIQHEIKEMVEWLMSSYDSSSESCSEENNSLFEILSHSMREYQSPVIFAFPHIQSLIYA